MKARVDRAGNVYKLDRQAEPDEVVSEEDVKDAPKLSRLLMRLLKDVAGLRRRFAPRSVDYEDLRVLSTTTTLRLPHGFGARVRWWLVDWAPTSASANYVPLLAASATTDLNTLVLTNITVGIIGAFDGKVSVRVEAS